MAKRSSLADLEALSRRIDELTREKRKYEDLVEGALQGILIVQQGRPVYANAKLARLFGYDAPADVLRLRSLSTLAAPDDLPRLRKHLDERRKDPEAASSLRFEGRRTDGQTVAVETHTRRIEWEGAPALQLTLVDRGEQSLAESAMLSSKRLLQTVFDTIPHWVFVKDRQSRILMANSALAGVCGMHPSELVGLHTDELPFGAAAEHSGFLASDRHVFESGQRVELQQPTTLPDGSQRVHNLIKMPLRDETGTVIGLVGLSEDITERSQTRQQLQESKILLDTILEHIPSALSVVDGNLNLAVYNDKFLDVLGFPREQARNWRTFEDFTRFNAERGEYGQGDVEQLVRERLELARQFLPHHFERRRPDGRVLEIWGNPLPHGGFITVYTDVTERKRAEEALAISERSQAIAQQVAHLGSWIWDPLPNKAYWSDELYRLLGCKPQEFEGCYEAMLRFVHPDDRERFSTTLKRAFKGQGPYDFEHRIVRADGTERIVQELAEIFRGADGRPRQVVGTVHDVTERKQAEQALRDSELRLRTLVLNLPVMLFTLDPTGRILFSAGKALTLLRTEPGDLVGRSALELAEGRPEIVADIQRALRGEEVVSEQRLGRTVLEFRYTPLKAESDHAAAVIGLAMDVTERTRIEQELAEERGNLERAVVQRTQELNESLRRLEVSNLQLEEANRAKSRFLSSMSHELRTPLNGILGFADLLRGQHFGTLNAKQRTYAVQIDTSGKHLLSLINDLLDIAKIDAGGMTVELEPLALREFLSSIASMMSSQFTRKGVTLDLKVDEGLESIYADGRKLRQILLNLLSNAVKFTPRNGHVQVTAERQGDTTFRIVVSDDGMGIEPEDLKHVFSEFHQARKVREEHYGGTGIGLALTRRLVELHGGEIGVESEVKRGSRFWFTLPLRTIPRERAAVPAERLPAPVGPVQPRRILVAEDNEVNLALILDILSIHGHETLVAHNGQEAIDLAVAHRPHLILMDVRMPVLDGIEATRRLRAMPDFGAVPIIALTASTGSHAEERQLAAGMTAHLAKPIQAAELFSVLERFLPA
jgi:PAS domain S-box-containing protein